MKSFLIYFFMLSEILFAAGYRDKLLDIRLALEMIINHHIRNSTEMKVITFGHQIGRYETLISEVLSSKNFESTFETFTFGEKSSIHVFESAILIFDSEQSHREFNEQVKFDSKFTQKFLVVYLTNAPYKIRFKQSTNHLQLTSIMKACEDEDYRNEDATTPVSICLHSVAVLKPNLK
jgi:hypothetical protein